jgi:hypothetical protein
VPAPTKKLPKVSVAAPVPPRETGNVPVVIADASRVTAAHVVLPVPFVLKKVFATPALMGKTKL